MNAPSWAFLEKGDLPNKTENTHSVWLFKLFLTLVGRKTAAVWLSWYRHWSHQRSQSTPYPVSTWMVTVCRRVNHLGM